LETSTAFIHAVQAHLGLAVGRGLASPVPTVYQVSLEVLETLVVHYRHAFKKEIEFFMSEIVLNILEMKSATMSQKISILKALGSIFHNPQALVEVYINYDCSTDAQDNIYERIIYASAKSIGSMQLPNDGNTDASTHGDLQRASLETLSVCLQSLSEWITMHRRAPSPDSTNPNAGTSNGGTTSPRDRDDNLEMLESSKQKKTILSEAIMQFNRKPKKGVELMQKNGLLSDKPADIARWLYNTEGLNKQALGEFMGEGFVLIVFSCTSFVTYEKNLIVEIRQT
jgi:brefeldin A-inhibited guanine nucleotide-exchange protein